MKITDGKFENIFVSVGEVTAESVKQGCLFLDGVWLCGALKNGIWVDGMWAAGTWEDIEENIDDEIFTTAFWLNGIFDDGHIFSLNNVCWVATKISPKAFRRPDSTMALNYAKYS